MPFGFNVKIPPSLVVSILVRSCRFPVPSIDVGLSLNQSVVKSLGQLNAPFLISLPRAEEGVSGVLISTRNGESSPRRCYAQEVGILSPLRSNCFHQHTAALGL